jgi:hypothetical protein
MEIEVLKQANATKDAIIEEIKQRLAKLEAQQNPQEPRALQKQSRVSTNNAVEKLREISRALEKINRTEQNQI